MTHPAIPLNEAAEQRVVMEWARLSMRRWPELVGLHHIPNQRSSKTQRFQLARQGVKAGIPDLCLPVARGGYFGLYIELKTTTGRVRPEQAEVIEYLQEQGYRAVVCRTAAGAIDELDRYLQSPPTAVRDAPEKPPVNHQPAPTKKR